MSEDKFALVPIESLRLIVDKLQEIDRKVEKLHVERELPEELTVKEAQEHLRLSRQRIYTLIYRGEMKAIQRTRNGKVTIPREEILRYRSLNLKPEY